MINKTLLLFCIYLPMVSFGQLELTEYEDKTIPLPPTEASLGTYSFSPISLAKGELGLQIPIHTIQGRDLSLPISMSYRPGVKIHDASEYTGHGWTLFAGGVITRKVNDRVDPHPRFNWALDYYTDENFNDMYTGILDTAFDEFSYNFNGYTGQFILDHDLVTPYFIREQRNWDVSINDDEIRITVENGTEYIFNETREEDIDYTFPEGYNDIATVAWYLTEIISPSVNEKIELIYTDNNLTYQRAKNNSLIIIPWTQTTHMLADPNDNDYNTFFVKRIQQIKLINNNIDISKVTFDANTLRYDTYQNAPESYALNKISIFDNPQSSQPLKYFNFDIENINNHRIFLKSIQEFSGDGSQSKPPYEFEYYNENSLPSRTTYKADHWGYYSNLHGGQFPFSTTFPWLNNPTKEPSFTAWYGSLKKVTFPTGGEQNFNYGLNSYNKTDWDYQDETLELFWHNSANRWENYYGTPLNSATKNFTITDQQYMKLNFTMILDKYSGANLGTLMDEVEDYKISITNNNTGEEVFYVIFEGDQGSNTPVSMKIYADEHIKYLNPDQRYSHPHPNEFYASNPLGHIYGGFVGRLGYGVHTGYNDSDPIYDSYFSSYSGKIGSFIDRDLYLVMQTGYYTAEIETSTRVNNMVDAEIKLSFEYHNGNMVDHTIPAGGIRIASQTLYDASSDADEGRTIYYNYSVSNEDGTSSTKSSGEITSSPLIPLYNPNHFGVGRNGQLADRYRLTSITKHIENSWVNYSEVKEREIGNGFKIHKFYNPSYSQYQIRLPHLDAYSQNQVRFEFTDPQYIWTSSWPHNYTSVPNGLVNKPSSIDTYKQESVSTSPVILNEEKFEYNLITRSNMLKGTLAAEYFGPDYQTGYIAHLTKIDDIYSLLKSKESIIYDTNGSNPISNKVKYEYDDGLYMPNKIITTDSENNNLIKKIKYSTEYSDTDFGFNSSIGLQDLKEKNIITPVEEQLWQGVITETEENVENNFYLIGGTLNIFDKVDPTEITNELIQKSKVINYKAGNSLPYNQEYLDNNYNNIDWFTTSINDNLSTTNLKYHSNGNLKEISKEDGTPVTYVWGYNNTQPIAKLENVSYENLTSAQQSAINAAKSASNNDIDSATEDNLITVLSALRTAFPEGMVTTYTYDLLIGVTSITDPTEQTIYYEYDNFNRLKHLKDKDGNTLSQNEYNYKN